MSKYVILRFCGNGSEGDNFGWCDLRANINNDSIHNLSKEEKRSHENQKSLKWPTACRSPKTPAEIFDIIKYRRLIASSPGISSRGRNANNFILELDHPCEIFPMSTHDYCCNREQSGGYLFNGCKIVLASKMNCPSFCRGLKPRVFWHLVYVWIDVILSPVARNWRTIVIFPAAPSNVRVMSVNLCLFDSLSERHWLVTSHPNGVSQYPSRTREEHATSSCCGQ